MANRTYLLYDARAYYDYHQGMQDIASPSDATVLTVSQTVTEAKGDAPDYGACICFSYILKRKRLADERMEFYYNGSEFSEEKADVPCVDAR